MRNKTSKEVNLTKAKWQRYRFGRIYQWLGLYMYLCQFQKGGVWSNSARVGKFVKGHAWVIAGVMQSPRNSCDVSVKENQPIHWLCIFCKSSEHALPAPLSAFHIKTELLIATSVYLCLSVCLFHYTALQLSVSLSVSPVVCLPPVSAPSCPSVYLSVRLYVCLSVDRPSCIVLGYLIRA